MYTESDSELYHRVITMKDTFTNRRFLVAALVVITFLALPFLSLSGDFVIERGRFISSGSDSESFTLHGPHRKLLQRSANAPMKQPDRTWGEKCTTADIVITQGPTAPTPNGIPTYTVEIVNACATGCDISQIHLNCGWFSSAHLVNHKILKRLGYNDCLLNDGKPLINGGTLKFQYSNTYLYPLSVSSVVCP